MARPGDFEIAEDVRGNTLVLRVTGELDLATVPHLEEALRKVEGRAERVVIDLRPTEFLDSTALRVLLRANAEADGRGYELGLVPGPPAVDRAFDVAGVKGVLPFVDPVD